MRTVIVLTGGKTSRLSDIPFTLVSGGPVVCMSFMPQYLVTVSAKHLPSYFLIHWGYKY